MSVTPDMLAVALGQAAPLLDSITYQQWEMWVADAEMLIEERKTKLGSTVIIGAAKRDYVVREAVVAHIKKPDDATQVVVSVDDASTSKTYKSGKGRVSLEEWWDFLGLVEVEEGAFSIDTLNTTTSHLPWCSASLGALYCSCGADIAGQPIYEVGEDW